VHGLFLSLARLVRVVATDSFEIPRKPERINAPAVALGASEKIRRDQ